jgi:hypothetical protein
METQERFAQSLDQQIEAIRRGLAVAAEVRARVFAHDWDGLSERLAELDRVSAEIAEREEERGSRFRELKEELGMPEDAGFYAVIVRLPEEQRESLAERFRSLKKQVLQFQGITWSIDAYTRTMSTTFQEILHTLYPHKRGTMYERSGKKRATESNPLVVNKRL